MAAFERIARDGGPIDILVNNVWGGYERMIDNGEFTWMKPFWEQPLWRWDAMFAAGVRAHYQASQLAAPGMIARRRGLIVNISHWAAQKHLGNVAYGVSKAATDKMTAHMAGELQAHGVTVVSLYPGMVRTEKVMAASAWLDMSNSESPEFIGRAISALGSDPNVLRHTGKVLVAAALALDYGFTDIDGKSPRPLTLADVKPNPRTILMTSRTRRPVQRRDGASAAAASRSATASTTRAGRSGSSAARSDSTPG